MFVTGGMNNKKGMIGGINDRFDKFISTLAGYYLINKENRYERLRYCCLYLSGNAQAPYLDDFLFNFDDIYDYCDKIYHISCRKFVKHLINEGNMPLENLCHVKRYIQLATDYWEKRKSFFSDIYKKHNVAV